MALNFDPMPKGSTGAGYFDDEQGIIRNTRKSKSNQDDVYISSRELDELPARRSRQGRPDNDESPIDDLRRRLSHWGEDPEAQGLLSDTDDENSADPNMPTDRQETDYLEKTMDRARSSDSVPKLEPVVEQEDSPYPEVRAAVHNYDIDEPCNTIRAWVIGMSLVFVGATMNTLFSLRAPSIGLGALIAQIIAWPIGHGWAKIMPNKQHSLFGIEWNLNPGPFNVKEHSVIVVMASVSFSAAYATDILLAQIAFYKQNFGLVFQILLVISTQSLGYGIAGMLRKYLVYPAANLVSVTLMNAMYEENEVKDPTILGGMMPRYKWFSYVVLGSFLYYFLPGFLMQFLSTFAFITWLYPNSPVVNQLFGQSTGISLIPLTLDWTQITGFVGSPLVPPFFAIANTIVGVLIFYMVGASIFHYTGTWYAEFLPISDSGIYDNTGGPYNISKIINPDFTLNEAAYKAYSPLFLSTTFAIAYGLSFAAIASLIVYTYLTHGSLIYNQFKGVKEEQEDIHMKLMKKYREVPTSWYTGLFVAMIVLSLFTVLSFPTKLEFWAFALAIFIATGFALPIGIIQAITNTQIGLNVLTEFIFGYIQPGRPLALMLFKTYGYITMSQALGFVGDLKFGHYMKIPPRTMFSAQVAATTLSCFIQVGVINFALKNIEGVCTPHQPQHFTCPAGKVFFSASVIWGLIGPARIFSPGQIYSGLFWFFGLGTVVPAVIYFAARKFPRARLELLNAPLIFGGAASIPPATPLNYLSWGIVGYIFQYVIRRKYFGWWSRLNYLTASGLDLGLALSTLFIFFVFTLHEIDAPHYWGNDVVTTTMDAQGTAIQRVVEPGQFFGPRTW